MEAISEPITEEPVAKEIETGRVVVEIVLSSVDDDALVRRGYLKPGQVRRTKIQALVDTGATILHIPEEEIIKLGLPFFRESMSKFANGQRSARKIYGPVKLEIMTRSTAVLVAASHPGTPALLGQIPLEGLDLMVDSKRLRLVPGHPDMPDDQVYDC